MTLKQVCKSGEILPVNIIVSPDLAKLCPYVVRIRVRWLPVYGCGHANPDTDDRNSPNIFLLVPFLSEYGCAYTDLHATKTRNTRTTLVVLCKWLHCDLWPFPKVSDTGPFGPSCLVYVLSYYIVVQCCKLLYSAVMWSVVCIL